mgnify:CR=1 FL=1
MLFYFILHEFEKQRKEALSFNSSEDSILFLQWQIKPDNVAI